jgi:hypothetical protein
LFWCHSDVEHVALEDGAVPLDPAGDDHANFAIAGVDPGPLAQLDGGVVERLEEGGVAIGPGEPRHRREPLEPNASMRRFADVRSGDIQASTSMARRVE